MKDGRTGKKNRNPAKPVAYDAEGRPLYAEPQDETEQDNNHDDKSRHGARSHVTAVPESYEGHNFNPRIRTQFANEPRVVHTTRAHEPDAYEISEELQKRHDESVKKFPNLNLSEGEYVILSIKRHPVGLLLPIISSIGLIILLMLAIIGYPLLIEDTALGLPGIGIMTIILMTLIVLVGVGGYISAWVYIRNTFYLTNESAIQEIQHSIFSKHEQTVSLGSVEDASFIQSGIFQTMLDYGSIRLSTEGEETTYRFSYVSNPKKQVAIVNNVVEGFKNGRPIDVEPYADD